MNLFERRLLSSGYPIIAGVDEAGRGPLAGPVVAACVIYHEGLLIPGLNDSKKILPDKRALIYDQIVSHTATQYGIGIVDAQEIDQINILQATFLSMKRAVESIQSPISYLLIDGNQLPNIPHKKEAIVKGDEKSISIAAASIIAKEVRDRIMEEYSKQYPEYLFDKHKGYGTKLHKEAIAKYGPCKIHRKSFRPISDISAL